MRIADLAVVSRSCMRGEKDDGGLPYGCINEAPFGGRGLGSVGLIGELAPLVPFRTTDEAL